MKQALQTHRDELSEGYQALCEVSDFKEFTQEYFDKFMKLYDEKEKKIIDFGSKILDWDTIKSYYYCEDISKEAINNRKLLRKIMLEENFAPYDGEWWHFSYGDREWAFYYNKSEALYKQVNSDQVFKK